VTKSIVVDIADLRVAADPEAELVTYSLGSCIGLAIWDPQSRVGGLLHYMLPDSSIARDRMSLNPAMFADTGIPLLFRTAYSRGAHKRRLVVKVAGGASMFPTDDRFDIGRQNYTALRKIFWRNNVLIQSEHVGGSISRTMRLQIGTGRVTIGNQRMKQVLI